MNPDRVMEENSRLTMHSRAPDYADVDWQSRKCEACNPSKEFIWQNDRRIEAQP